MVGTNELDGLCGGDMLDSDSREDKFGEARAVPSNVNEASKIGKGVVHYGVEPHAKNDAQHLEIP